MIRSATKYPCPTCHRRGAPRLRRPTSVPHARHFHDTLLVGVHHWDFRGERVMVDNMIDDATRFHVAEAITRQTAVVLYVRPSCGLGFAGLGRRSSFWWTLTGRRSAACLWTTWARKVRRSWLMPAEAHWTRDLVKRHCDYLHEMVAKMEPDGLPPDISAQYVIDRTTAAKNVMSKIRRCAPSQCGLAT